MNRENLRGWEFVEGEYVSASPRVCVARGTVRAEDGERRSYVFEYATREEARDLLAQDAVKEACCCDLHALRSRGRPALALVGKVL